MRRWFQMLTSLCGGTDANRNVVITPVAGESGTATITVSVSDGTLAASTNFVLTVNAQIQHQPLLPSRRSQQMKIRRQVLLHLPSAMQKLRRVD